MSPEAKKDSWFYLALKDVDRFQLNVNNDEVLNRTMVWINMVVKQGDKRLGIAGTGLQLDSFIERLIKSEDNTSVTSILIDPSGTIKAHPNPSLIDYKNRAQDGKATNTIYRLISGEQGWDELKRTLASLKSAPESVAKLNLLVENQPRLVSVAYLPEIDWYMLSLIDLDSAVRIGNFVPIILVVLISLVALVLMITLLINRTILTPLGRLATSARSITAGDYSVRTVASRDDEIGELTRTFNSMLDTIENNTRELKRYSGELEKRGAGEDA